MLPLQVVDKFLVNYNVGQAILLGFFLTTVAVLPIGSRKVLALNTMVFGALFLLTPVGISKPHYLFLGLALLVIAPILYVTARR